MTKSVPIEFLWKACSNILLRSEVDQNGCWIWKGAKGGDGYGHIRLGRNVASVHRVSYQSLVGDIPAGMQIDHLCRNRICVNPSHLEAVTQKVNVLRGNGAAARAARQTHCIRGHPFDEENTRIAKRGQRVCRTCEKKYFRERYEAAKARA